MEHLPANQNAVAFIKEDAFENTVFTMWAIHNVLNLSKNA